MKRMVSSVGLLPPPTQYPLSCRSLDQPKSWESKGAGRKGKEMKGKIKVNEEEGKRKQDKVKIKCSMELIKGAQEGRVSLHSTHGRPAS